MSSAKIPRVAILPLLALCIFALAGCTEDEKPAPGFSNAQAIAELSTLDVYSHNVTKLAKPGSWFFNHGYKKTWYEYGGMVTLGIDASKVKIGQPNEHNVVTIQIPQAQVLGEPDVDDNSFSDPITERGFLTDDFSADEKAQAFSDSQDDMLAKIANDDQLLSRARARAKAILEEYVTNVGKSLGETYVVNFVDVE